MPERTEPSLPKRMQTRCIGDILGKIVSDPLALILFLEIVHECYRYPDLGLDGER